MTPAERVRACYQHAVLCWVENRPMSNMTLRTRLGVTDQNYSTASRLIKAAIEQGMIKRSEDRGESSKHAQYVPFWA